MWVLTGEVAHAPAIFWQPPSWITAHPVSLLHHVGILLLSFLLLRCMSVRFWRYVLAGLKSNWPSAINRAVSKMISEILLKIGREALESTEIPKVICSNNRKVLFRRIYTVLGDYTSCFFSDFYKMIIVPNLLFLIFLYFPFHWYPRRDLKNISNISQWKIRVNRIYSQAKDGTVYFHRMHICLLKERSKERRKALVIRSLL